MERKRLIEEYYSALQAYHEAVGQLRGLQGAQFTEAYERAEQARRACEACRAALEKHERAKGP